MARSLTTAVISDAALLKDLIADEDTAKQDQAMAQRLSARGPPSKISVPTIPEPATNDGIIARLAAVYITGRIEDEILGETMHDDASVAT